MKGHDYAQPGAYFVTVCTRDREWLFGDIVDGEMCLNPLGVAVHQEWSRTAQLHENVELDAFTIMPNHVHGIVIITQGRGTACRAPTEAFGRPVPNSLPTILRAFKSASTKRINEMRKAPVTPVWQRNYYEHMIRIHTELNAIRQYLLANPAKWATDENYNP